MRDASRIDLVLAKIGAAWKERPYLRLGQLLEIAIDSLPVADIFYIEDDELIRLVEAIEKPAAEVAPAKRERKSVWMYVDEYSSGAMEIKAENDPREGITAVSLEYEAIEKAFREGLPQFEFTFRRNQQPITLHNSPGPAIYIWDIGGLCAASPMGESQMYFSDLVAREIKEHPNCTFVPWSRFTQDYAKAALQDLMGDAEFEKGVPVNVILPDTSKAWEYAGRECDLSMKILQQRAKDGLV